MFRKLSPDERFVHAPTKTSFDGIEVEIKENGVIVLGKKVSGFLEGAEEEYDEVEIKAGTIFKIASLLRDTRRIVRINEAAKV